MRTAMLCLLTVGLLSGVSLAADRPLAWPQFRGPNGSGVADDQKPPVEFGPAKNVKWKIDVPAGYSSPIVAGDKLVITAFDDGKLFTIAYNRATGKEAWRREAPAKQIELYHKTEGSPAASTPVTDGQRIVSYFGSCGLFCYDLAGKELWHYEMPTAATAMDFGTGTSPVIAAGAVVVVRDQLKDAKIVAVSLAEGKRLWEKPRQSVASHSTPAVVETPAGTQVVVPGTGRMIGYDAKTGDEKWFVPGMPAMCCASPLLADGQLFFAGWAPGDDFKLPTYDALLAMAKETDRGHLIRESYDRTELKGFFDNHDLNKDGKVTRDEWQTMLSFLDGAKNSALALKPGGSGDVTESHLVWRNSKTKGLPYVSTMIHYKDQCVMIKDGGIVTACGAADGSELYTQRAAATGRYYASPVAANGFIYFTSLDEGTITVMKAGLNTPEIIAKNELDERIPSTPAIADDTLYVRTASHLYAFSDGKK